MFFSFVVVFFFFVFNLVFLLDGVCVGGLFFVFVSDIGVVWWPGVSWVGSFGFFFFWFFGFFWGLFVILGVCFREAYLCFYCLGVFRLWFVTHMYHPFSFGFLCVFGFDMLAISDFGFVLVCWLVGWLSYFGLFELEVWLWFFAFCCFLSRVCYVGCC